MRHAKGGRDLQRASQGRPKGPRVLIFEPTMPDGANDADDKTHFPNSPREWWMSPVSTNSSVQAASEKLPGGGVAGYRPLLFHSKTGRSCPSNANISELKCAIITRPKAFFSRKQAHFGFLWTRRILSLRFLCWVKQLDSQDNPVLTALPANILNSFLGR
jgi:hypothetical protein